jgi:hypothetical protein
MNIAPCFFGTVLEALWSTIILWVDKLLGGKSECGFIGFLSFVKNNIQMFSNPELQRRRSYPDNHWMLKREELTVKTVQEDLGRIASLSCLQSIKVRRDKFHAHFDKDFFFDRDKLDVEAPIKLRDLDQIMETMKDILNSYSAQFDGNTYEIEPLNIYDIDYILDSLHAYKNIE